MVGECVLRFEAHARIYYARDGVPTGEHTTIRYALRPLVKRFGPLPVRDFGPKVSDILFARLAAQPELFLVDRADIKKILSELELNVSGAVKPAESPAPAEHPASHT